MEYADLLRPFILQTLAKFPTLAAARLFDMVHERGYQAVLAGHTVLFVTAGQLLGDLAALDSDSTLRRRRSAPSRRSARPPPTPCLRVSPRTAGAR